MAVVTGVQDQGVPRAGLRFPPIPLLVAAIVAVLVVPVILVVLLASLRTGTALPFDATPLTLDAYGSLLSDPLTYRVILNTVVYAAIALVIGMALAVPMVWLVERTDMPGRSAVPALLFVPLAIPGAVLAIGWVLLLSPRTGFLNVILRGLAGTPAVGANTTGPFNIYTFPGLVLLTGTAIAPSMFFLLSAAFANMDAQLEDAGATSGAGTGDVLRRITLPLMAPSLAAAAIYYVMLLFETFEIPLIIGFNANYRVLSIQLFDFVQPQTSAPEYGQAAALGTLLILVGTGMAWLYARMTRQTARFVVIRGRQQLRRAIKLGPWRYVALGAVVLYLLVCDLLPLAALAWTSLFPNYKPVSFDALASASFSVYGSVFADPRWGAVVVNTVSVVVVSSIGATLLATIVSWVVVRSRSGSLQWLDTLAFLPRTIPGVVLALGVFLIYIRTPLYATIWILVVAYLIAFMPYCVRVMNATLLQIDRELEEAAYTSGADERTTFTAIVLPLMRPAVTNCVLWVMAHSVRDFTFALILGTASNALVAQLLWQTWATGNDISRAAAIAVLLCCAALVVFVPLRWRFGSREMA